MHLTTFSEVYLTFFVVETVALRVLLGIEISVAESKHSLSISSKGLIGLGKLLSVVTVWNRMA